MASKAKKTVERKGREVPKDIRMKLSKDQCLERSNKAAQLSKEMTEMEEQFKTEETEWKQTRAQFKTGIKNLSDQIKKFLVEVKAQSAESTETVLLVLNHDAGVAEYWFPPSGKDSKIVETRPLEDNERQLSLVTEQAAAMTDKGQEIFE